LLIISHTDIIPRQNLKSSILREVSACSRGPKALLFHLAKFLLEALWVADYCLMPNEQFSAVSRRVQIEVTFWFNQPAELDFYSASSMKLQYAVEHVAPLGQIMIPIQTVFAPIP
jgi:hypothetical protein